MPLRPALGFSRACILQLHDAASVFGKPCKRTPRAAPCFRAFHTTQSRCFPSSFGGKNHYERLNLRPDAAPVEIKKSFYRLSKKHHPDANRGNPDAAETFSLLSESYTVLSDPARRSAYDRDVLRLHQGGGGPHAAARGSYHSTSPAGGRSPSGLSRRRTSFRGPPPSFYRSGGWGTQSEKRRQAHEESTGSGSSSAAGGRAGANTGASGSADARGTYAGMGPGADPFGHRDEVPHFDKRGHTRTHRHEDERRWQRQRRAMGDDGIEFEPQTSLGGHFLIVSGILAATLITPVLYLQFMRVGRRKKEQT